MHLFPACHSHHRAKTTPGWTYGPSNQASTCGTAPSATCSSKTPPAPWCLRDGRTRCQLF